MPTQDAVIFSNVSDAEKEAMCDILDALVGTELERTGDITFIINGARYVISSHTAQSAHAAIVRPAGAEVLASPYRGNVVYTTATRGLGKALNQAVGQEFTLQELIATDWDGLSAVEQRNAGKLFRRLLKASAAEKFNERKSTDNEWHYTRI